MLRVAFVLSFCPFVAGCRQPAADFTAAEFHEQYKDWRAANERYAGKSIAIRGEIRNISHSWLTPHDWETVTLGGPESGVICHFPPAAVDQLEWLREGQSVVIRGTCEKEFNGLPILSDCVVVR